MSKNMDINKCSRNGFKGCYYDAGGYGQFKGEVVQVKENGSDIRYLFKRIYVEYQSGVDILEDKEDHVWIFKANAFKDKGIKVGDCVSFNGEIIPYVRKDGTYDLGIETPEDITKIENYELPSDEQMMAQFLKQLRCETCLYSEQCYGAFCMME